ncbi:MAG: rhodanese-like domain-containing protein [Acidobacteriota bacterium]
MPFRCVVGALLLLPSLAVAEPPQAAPIQTATSAAQPQAPKMASDDVLALVEKGDVFFLDVREPWELEKLGTFEGYVNIPVDQIEARLAEIPKDKAIITA